MKTFLMAVGLIAAVSGCRAAEVTESFQERERAWAAAVQGGDLGALDKLYTDDLIYAHATGKVESKKEYLDRLRTGAQKYEHVTLEKTRVVPYGDAVVTHSFVRMNGTSSGKLFDDHVMMLHIWVKQGGTWRIAAHQTTKLQ